jgi:hypothetical protein
LTNSNDMVGVAKRTFHTNESVAEVKDSMTKRNLFSELTEGLDALRASRENHNTPSANTVPNVPETNSDKKDDSGYLWL